MRNYLELALCTVITALLVSSAVLAVQGARISAGRMQCADQLRRIGNAVTRNIASGKLPAAEQHGQWFDRIARELELRCPAAFWQNDKFVPGLHTVSFAYGMNINASGAEVAKVRRPSGFLVIGETCQKSSWMASPAVMRRYECNDRPTPEELDTDNSPNDMGWMRFRHAGNANLLMLDNSVRLEAKNNFPGWNNCWEY